MTTTNFRILSLQKEKPYLIIPYFPPHSLDTSKALRLRGDPLDISHAVIIQRLLFV